ncbi:uncharacterized protein LOC104886100 isoform X4 [Beta vulgaris subsp. vulgaris]|nr:uncharacterized protein LOC104886100 isoform X4 [Beta vulgaris subsp. vulgaris]
MTYRCRGGLNGRGPIVRGPRKVVETRDFTESHATENALENATTEIEHARNQQSETHIRSDEQLTNGDLDRGITVSDDRGNPQAKLVLDPDKLWFVHRDVVDVVAETSYKTYFKGPYYNWGMTPREVKERWWNAFKQEFSWDPSVASLVKKEWQSKCARRLSGIVSKVCSDPTYSATWCAPSLRERMKEMREKDDDFIRRRNQCSKNRLSNENQKVHHRQGSISTEEVKLKLNEFEKKKSANLECDSETQKTEDELFFEAVGGWNEKGRIFGLGAAAHSYYERPTFEERHDKKSRRDYIKSLETQVVELAAQNDEQKRTRCNKGRAC